MTGILKIRKKDANTCQHFSSFVARSTAGTNAVDSILAIKKSGDVSVNSRGVNIGSGLGSTAGASQAWTDASVKTKYATLFPGAEFPSKPSEWEMLRYEIYSRYADTTGADAWQVKISSTDEKETAHEQARMQAIDLRLQMLLIERTERHKYFISSSIRTATTTC